MAKKQPSLTLPEYVTVRGASEWNTTVDKAIHCMLVQALAVSNGNVRSAADALGVERTTAYRYVRKFSLAKWAADLVDKASASKKAA
jgi:transcriptional regulator of acetoin/glycerol metabolism